MARSKDWLFNKVFVFLDIAVGLTPGLKTRQPKYIAYWGNGLLSSYARIDGHCIVYNRASQVYVYPNTGMPTGFFFLCNNSCSPRAFSSQGNTRGEAVLNWTPLLYTDSWPLIILMSLESCGPVFTKSSYARVVRKRKYQPIRTLDILAKAAGQWQKILTTEKPCEFSPWSVHKSLRNCKAFMVPRRERAISWQGSKCV